MNNRKGRGRGSQTSQQQRAPTQQQRPSTPRRPRTGQGHASGGEARGGPSSSVGTQSFQQSSVREMISRLDSARQPASRSGSPSKRPRHSREPSTASDHSDRPDQLSGSSRPLTEATLLSALQRMTDQIKADMAKEFGVLKEDMQRLHGRVYELEQHVEQRDVFIDELERRIGQKDERISSLEQQLDDLICEQRRPDLILSGDAVPPAPVQHWTEDVADTAVKLLNECLPDVSVSREHIQEATRTNKRKNIVCRFKSFSRDSARDRLYEERFNSKPPMNAEGAEKKRLFISENLTPYRQNIYQALRREKKENRLYTVFSKHGEVYCKKVRHGQKIRVSDMGKISAVLRDEY